MADKQTDETPVKGKVTVLEGMSLKTSTTQLRPGRNTSEFWVTAVLALIIILGAGAGFGTGKLSYAQGLEVLAIGLGILGFGYSAARGLAKQGPLKGLMVLLCFGVLSGCGVTFKGALEGMHKGGKVLSATYEPGFQAKCLERARACRGKVMKLEECTPYITCRDIQRGIASGVAGTHEQLASLEKLRRRAVNAGLLKEGE